MEDDATDNENGDEDDSDFEEIQIFDLALIKQLAPTQQTPVLAGTDIVYQITIFNQGNIDACLLYTSPSPRDATLSRMPSSA